MAAERTREAAIGVLSADGAAHWKAQNKVA